MTQQQPEQGKQRARYSTSWPAGRTGAWPAHSLVGSGGSRGYRAPTLSVNQWTFVICLGVVLFLGVALASGVIVGRVLRAPQVARRNGLPGGQVTAFAEPQRLLAIPGAGANPQAEAGGVGVVSLLLDPTLSAGDMAPDFELERLNGDTLSMTDLRGYVVLVNFWATWCAWCKDELPALQDVYDQYRDDGLVVVGIDVEEPGQLVEAYAQHYGLSFPIGLDMGGTAKQAYQVRGLPTTYFVDRGGRIVYVQRGAMREDELERHVLRALGAQ